MDSYNNDGPLCKNPIGSVPQVGSSGLEFFYVTTESRKDEHNEIRKESNKLVDAVVAKRQFLAICTQLITLFPYLGRLSKADRTELKKFLISITDKF